MPLCEFSTTTGSTEFWLGSHAHTSGAEQVIATPESSLTNARLRVGEPTCDVKKEVFEERRKIRPPIQPVCGPGDIMLRDLRTWHAGMPNESEQYRIMIALGYQVRFQSFCVVYWCSGKENGQGCGCGCGADDGYGNRLSGIRTTLYAPSCRLAKEISS